MKTLEDLAVWLIVLRAAEPSLDDEACAERAMTMLNGLPDGPDKDALRDSLIETGLTVIAEEIMAEGLQP